MMNERNKIEVGKKLKELRLEQGISLRDAAVMIGLKATSPLSIRRLEEGIFDDTKLVKKYFKALGYSLRENYSFKIVKKS